MSHLLAATTAISWLCCLEIYSCVSELLYDAAAADDDDDDDEVSLRGVTYCTLSISKILRPWLAFNYLIGKGGILLFFFIGASSQLVKVLQLLFLAFIDSQQCFIFICLLTFTSLLFYS